jgi:hypothetical protein
VALVVGEAVADRRRVRRREPGLAGHGDAAAALEAAVVPAVADADVVGLPRVASVALVVADVVGRALAERRAVLDRLAGLADDRGAAYLGFGHIVTSEIDAPNLVNLV